MKKIKFKPSIFTRKCEKMMEAGINNKFGANIKLNLSSQTLVI